MSKQVTTKSLGGIQIIKLLKSYRLLKLKEAQLLYEVENNVISNNHDDIIKQTAFFMNAAKIDTSKTAKHYGDITDIYGIIINRLKNTWRKDELASALNVLQFETRRLELYVDLIGGRHAEVIRLLYFNSMTMSDAANEANISLALLKKVKRECLDLLAEMYGFIFSYQNS